MDKSSPKESSIQYIQGADRVNTSLTEETATPHIATTSSSKLKMGKERLNNRLWMILALVFMAASIALSISLILVTKMVSEKDNSVQDEDHFTPSMEEILALYPMFFRTVEQQKHIEESYAKLIIPNNIKIAPEDTNYPPQRCIFQCLNRTSQTALIETPVVNNACCISTTSFIDPNSAKAIWGETVTVIQYGKFKQYFPSEDCRQVEGCTGCTCGQQNIYTSAVIRVGSNVNEEDICLLSKVGLTIIDHERILILYFFARILGPKIKPGNVTSEDMDGKQKSLVLITTVVLSTAMAAFTVEDETRLRSDKLTNYSSEVRPSGQTIIRMSFFLTAISGLDLRNQIFSVAGWWSMHWTDSRLAWTRSDYNDIPVIQIFEDKVWTPSVVVDNSVKDLSAIDEDNIPLRVDNLGTVNWNPPGLISVSCDMDITHFPFDTQVCALQVTSFGYTIQELDIYVFEDGINLSYFSEDGEWTILSTWNQRATYKEGNYDYARVYYYFKLKRKPLYYGLNMLLPVLVTAVLTVFVFLLPADSGEKIGYCLTVLLAFMVILTLIAADLPTTAANTSLLELYIAIVLIMGALSVVLSIFVLDIYHRPEQAPIPKFVRNLTLLGMRINCYKTSPYCGKEKVEPEIDYIEHFPKERALRMKPSYMSVHYIRDTLESDNPYKPQPNGRAIYSNTIYHPAASTRTDRRASEGTSKGVPPQKPVLIRKHTSLNLSPVTAQSTPGDISRGGEITWQTVSIVLDGFLLRFYTLFLVVSSVVFMVLLMDG
ncbi:hypothetical protein RRG08_050975 [Elysia crispata]|uniref:Uncharacterized protein n=1 Tax=Elysia crispata TaxID=231223 RepID=A0AAE0ZZ03_9GAST|nr:hypothetical protein RRG08_050975 [Elysia crispata]